jgi:hypothetical protein
LPHHDPWRASARRARSARAAADRRLRRLRWRRSGLVVALASLALAGGAAGQSGGASPTARPGVAAVQRALGIPADGLAGPQTRRAIRRFQREQGLTVDGIAGPETLAALGLGPDARRTSALDPAELLAAIAACESAGDPAAVSADGRYRGKYQFSRATWRELGGAGDPAAAPEAEQDARAAALLAERGTAPWPNCA